MKINNLSSAEKVELTFLVENKSEMLVKAKNIISYYTKQPLLGEPGLSILIRIDDSNNYILFDSGAGNIAIINNAQKMGINLSQIQKIVLSHGHFDHTGGMETVLSAIDNNNVNSGRMNIPLITHPETFRKRWMLWDTGEKNGPLLTPKEKWKKLGAEITEIDIPYEVTNGCYTTGYIPRKSFESFPLNGIKNVYENNFGDFVLDDIADEIGLVINLKHKGLVIISGCAHAGILNTIYAAQEITGIKKIYAVIGGFHLAFSSDDYIIRVIEELKKLSPKYIIPTHCSGFSAMKLFSDLMPEEFLLGTVGATVKL